MVKTLVFKGQQEVNSYLKPHTAEMNTLCGDGVLYGDDLYEMFHNIGNIYEDFCLIVLEKEEKVVGFAFVVAKGPETIELYYLCTVPRKGYGKILLKLVDDYGRELGRTKVKVNSVRDAASFYRERGFEETSELEFERTISKGGRRKVTSKKAAKKTCAPGYAVYNYRKTRKGVFYDCAPKRRARKTRRSLK
jgi:N-acetylglutamate synthase-like GNAT family acetyltransferase